MDMDRFFCRGEGGELGRTVSQGKPGRVAAEGDARHEVIGDYPFVVWEEGRSEEVDEERAVTSRSGCKAHAGSVPSHA